jgi:alpha-beta hydrolase superfamily lysophospholipase
MGSTWPPGDRFAEVFAAGGLGALVFDNRSFGASEETGKTRAPAGRTSSVSAAAEGRRLHAGVMRTEVGPVDEGVRF